MSNWLCQAEITFNFEFWEPSAKLSTHTKRSFPTKILNGLKRFNTNCAIWKKVVMLHGVSLTTCLYFPFSDSPDSLHEPSNHLQSLLLSSKLFFDIKSCNSQTLKLFLFLKLLPIIWNNILNKNGMYDVLRNLVPLAQLEKSEKTPNREVSLLVKLTLLKVTLLHGCF